MATACRRERATEKRRDLTTGREEERKAGLGVRKEQGKTILAGMRIVFSFNVSAKTHRSHMSKSEGAWSTASLS